MSGIARGTYPVLLKAAGAQAASTVGPNIVIPDGYTRVVCVVNCTAATGTAPTLNVYIQNGITFPASGDVVPGPPTGTLTWNDVISFTQITVAATYYAGAIETASFMNIAQDAALAAGSIRSGVFGNHWRYKSAITATTPVFTYSVFAVFFP